MKRLRGRGARYASFLAWFAADAFLRYRWRLVALVGANIAGLACQAAAFLIAYRYAAALEGDKTVHALGLALPARSSFELLLGVAAAVLVLSVGAAFLVIRGRMQGIRLAREYGDFCNQRIYVLASRMMSAPIPDTEKDLDSRGSLNAFAVLSGNQCGTALRILARALLPIGTVVVAGAALAVIDVALSSLLLAILAVAAVFLYSASIEGATRFAAVRTSARQLAEERRELSERVARSPAAIAPDDDGLLATFRSGAARRTGDAMVGQREAMERGHFVAQVAVGCAIFLVLLVQGSATLRNESNWSALIAYLGVFSLFASNFANVTRMLVAINRFYPVLAEYARFVQHASAPSPAAAGAAQRFRIEAPSLIGAAPGLAAGRGDRLALVMPGTLDRYALIPLALALPAGLPWFAGARFLPKAGSLRNGFGLPERYDAAQLEADLAALGLERPADPRALEPRLAFALAALAGIRGEHAVLVLEASALAALPRGAAGTLLEMARERLVLIAYRAGDDRRPGGFGESALVVTGSARVLGWAPIAAFEASDARVQQAIAEAVRQEKRAKEAEAGALEQFEEL